MLSSTGSVSRLVSARTRKVKFLSFDWPKGISPYSARPLPASRNKSLPASFFKSALAR